MFLPLICLAIETPYAPVIPAGLNKACVQAAYAVEADLAAGNFDKAKGDAALLPHAHIRYRWDDSRVPAPEKAGFRLACQSAMTAWHLAVPGLEFEEGGSPDIEFSFTGPLPISPESPLPAGIDLQFQAEASPRLTDKIALERMDPPEPITTSVVHNEVAFAIGQYLGLEELPRFGSFASRSDQNTDALVACGEFERGFVSRVLSLSEQLDSLIAKEQTVIAGKPVMGLSTAKIEGVKGYQDEPLQIQFDVLNSGNTDLNIYVLPDCGCLAPEAPPVIKPNSSGTITADVNTAIYHSGQMEHSLLIYSNDPNWSIERVPVSLDVEPAYRFIQPGGSVHSLGAEGASFDVYLAISPHSKIPVLTASLVGTKADIQFHEWTGVVPGDDQDGQINGYKFHVDVRPVHDFGLIPATLMLGTANPEFREISCTLNLQKGIVALPGQVYFGTVSKSPKTINFVISSPGRNFEITKIDTGSPYLFARVLPGKEKNKYQIALTYDGKADVGLIQSELTIDLSDPAQPVLRVRAEADVR